MQDDDSKIDLNVPLHLQTKDVTCVPSCCKMMLDYLNEVILTKPERDLTEDELAKIMKTTISGTSLADVENINKVLTISNPSVEFIAEIKPYTLDDIRKELKKDLPVSVWIYTGVAEYQHFIVITGIDEIKKTITYNDPIYGKDIKISQSEFLTKWEKGGALMIKTEIGRINRDTLEQWQESTNERS